MYRLLKNPKIYKFAENNTSKCLHQFYKQNYEHICDTNAFSHYRKSICLTSYERVFLAV